MFCSEVALSWCSGNVATDGDVPSAILSKENTFMLAAERPVHALFVNICQGRVKGSGRVEEGVLL